MSNAFATKVLDLPFFVVDSKGAIGGQYATLDQAHSMKVAWDHRHPEDAPHFVFVSVDAPWVWNQLTPAVIAKVEGSL